MLSLASPEDLYWGGAGVARYASGEMDDLEALIYLGHIERRGLI